MAKKKSIEKKKKGKEKIDWRTKKVGDEVINGHISTIYYSTKAYIIYRTLENPTILSYDNDPDIQQNVNRLMPAFGKLRTHFSSDEDRINYFPQIAGALALCFENDFAGANSLIDQIITDCEKQRSDRNNAQLIYQGICFLFVVINIVIALLMKYTTNTSSYEGFWLYFRIALWGSFGGFISISYKVNRFEYELNTSRPIRILSAFSRIFIAMLSSVIIFSLIRSNIALGIFSTKDTANPYLYYSLAVLSGFSESFVPDVLKVMEKKPAQEQAKKINQ